jgi:hypothetical protein
MGKIGSLFGGEDIAGEFLDKLTATQVQNSFALMPVAAASITVMNKTEDLWLEVAIWLRGLYQRSYEQISPYFKEGGALNPAVFHHLGDNDDRNFFKHKAPLVKMTLAQYHKLHYETLVLLVPPHLCSELLPLLPNDFVEQYTAKYNNESHQPVLSPALPLAGSIASVMQANEEKPVVKEGLPRPEEGKENAVRPLPTVISPPGMFKPVTKKPSLKPLQLDDFEIIKGQEEELAKFAKFNSLLLSSEFNEDQNLDIEQIKPQILGTLNNYIKASFTSSWFLPTGLVPRKHINEVKAAYDDINESISPRQYIIALYTLWAAVYADKSPDIGPKTEKLLTSAFNILHSSLETKKQNTKAMNR